MHRLFVHLLQSLGWGTTVAAVCARARAFVPGLKANFAELKEVAQKNKHYYQYATLAHLHLLGLRRCAMSNNDSLRDGLPCQVSRVLEERPVHDRVPGRAGAVPGGRPAHLAQGGRGDAGPYVCPAQFSIFRVFDRFPFSIADANDPSLTSLQCRARLRQRERSRRSPSTFPTSCTVWR
jgi:hypothetical protein